MHESSVNPAWHALAPQEAVRAVDSDAERGLSAQAVAQRQAQQGKNALPEPPSRSLVALFLGQFRSPLIYLLFGAAALALLLGERGDALVIGVVVLLNAIIGAFQEGRAERALRALRQMEQHKARVLRDGVEREVAASELVSGDVLLLSAGELVLADARVLSAARLHVAEAALTGESVPIAKHERAVDADRSLPDRSCMLYAGTYVTGGRARAGVVAIGSQTELGRIAAMAEASEPPKTPLERRIEQFGRYVMLAAAVLFLVILGAGLLRGIPLPSLVMLGVSQVVGLIPEGLPVAMTIGLAAGVQRMARRRAIVRRLSAVETLGSTTVICSDKTGTLTRGEMTVRSLMLAGGRTLEVSGIGYAPEGAFFEGDRQLAAQHDLQLQELLRAVVLCNDAQLIAPASQDEAPRPVGDPTEVALLTLAEKGGVSPSSLRAQAPREAEIPFDPTVKLMATGHAGAAGRRVVIKGAPELVMELCETQRTLESAAGGEPRLSTRPFERSERAQVRAATQAMAERALRLLAVAVIEDAELSPDGGVAGLRGRATFLGVVGQIDPPRAEAKDAVARCRSAGIRPVMITGDHKLTGLAVARELGIARPGDFAIEGKDLEDLSLDQLSRRLPRASVFARVLPAQKLRIIEAYQRRGAVVAMTGDGVNDAPALRRADVGVAMGATGTEVAKEAAELVLTDDNFATLVDAVEEGRVVYRNIKKVVLLLFATSLAEALVLVLAMLLGYPAPFAAVQILWNNLVTEGVITVNLILDPPEGDEMAQAPIDADEPLIGALVLSRIALMTPAILASALGWYVYRVEMGTPLIVAQSETFTLLAICEWYNVLNCRSEHRSVFRSNPFRNPWLVGGLLAGNLLQWLVIFGPLNHAFHTVPIAMPDVLAIGAVGSLVLWLEEVRKWFYRRRRRAGSD